MVYASAAVLGGIGAVIGLGLLVALRKLRTEENEQIELLTQLLPGANCGACGSASCADMARALVAGERNISACPFTTESVSARIAELLNTEVTKEKRKIAQVLCQGRAGVASRRAEYSGIQDCWAAETVARGDKGCTYGCLGLGSCVKVCPVNAISVPEGGVAEIDVNLCTGCGLCVDECPRNVIQLIEEGTLALPRCVTLDAPKFVRSVCDAGCLQCKRCERACPTDACKVIDGRVIIDAALCTGCGACAEACPTGVIDMTIGDAFKKGRVQAEPEKEPAAAHCAV